MKLRVILLTLFLLVSILNINPNIPQMRSEYKASQLQKVTMTEGNTQRTDYLNSDGKVTIAADLGYATKVSIRTEEGDLEFYLDDVGAKTIRSAGYYGVLREFDDAGNNVRITFLNMDGKPMMLPMGFAVEEREFNASRQVVMNRYFDVEGNPANLPYCSKKNEYDEDGNIVKITYLDAEGNPIRNREGNAISVLTYYKSGGPENGKVRTEFYYNKKEEPIALSIGQYGTLKEYDENGQEAVLTYLNAEGLPMNTTKGYASIKRTFYANNSVATEMYFDADGNPVSLSEGQYGQKKKDGRIVYLNKDGSEQLNIKNLMYNQSWFVILSAALVVFISSMISREKNMILLAIYLCAVTYMTLMYRENGGASANLELFWSYKRAFTDSGASSDILRNIWLFIPLGAIFYCIYPKLYILFIPLVISALIEIIQYYTGTGLCEFDDVISNVLGSIIGYEASMLFSRHKRIMKKDMG